jgi:hypothetical protein
LAETRMSGKPGAANSRNKHPIVTLFSKGTCNK